MSELHAPKGKEEITDYTKIFYQIGNVEVSKHHVREYHTAASSVELLLTNCITPSVFRGGYRNKKNITSVHSFIVLDNDGTKADFDTVIAYLESNSISYLAYPSASHYEKIDTAYKMHIVVPVTGMTVDNYTSTSKALFKELGIKLDESSKDLARFFYPPVVKDITQVPLKEGETPKVGTTLEKAKERVRGFEGKPFQAVIVESLSPEAVKAFDAIRPAKDTPQSIREYNNKNDVKELLISFDEYEEVAGSDRLLRKNSTSGVAGIVFKNNYAYSHHNDWFGGRCIDPFEVYAHYLHADDKTAALKSLNATVFAEPEPVKELEPLSNITPDMLPRPIRMWVVDVCERINTPLNVGAITAIVILGNLIGSKVGVRPKQLDNWTEYPNLWGMVIGDPSTKKTPVFKAFEKSLGRLYSKAKADYSKAQSDYTKEVDARKARIEDIKKDKTIETESEKQKKIQSLIEDDGDLPPKPILRRYIINDATPEKVVEICKENPRGVLQHGDELSGFLKSFEKKGYESARSLYLQGWVGRMRLWIDRIMRGTDLIESVTLGVFGNIQPDKIRKYVYEAGNGNDDGLLQRFQLTMFVEALPPKWTDRTPNKVAREEFDKLIEFFTKDEFIGAMEDKFEEGLFYYNFDISAQSSFEEWWINNEEKARRELNKALQGHLLKYNKLVCGLSLIFHLCDLFEGYDVSGGISADNLDKALQIVNVLEQHAYRLYSTFEVEEKIKEAMADRILHYLKDKELPIKFQTITQGVKHNDRRPTKKEIINSIKGFYQYAGSSIVKRFF